MLPEHTVDRKPEIIPPATPISTPSSTFNPNATVLELILKLRSCFQLKDSEEVAHILKCREDKLKNSVTDLKKREDKLNANNIELKTQLKTLNDKFASIEASGEKFGVDKREIERDLKRCKAECEEYRDKQLSVKYELEKARLDLKMLREKEEIDLKMLREKEEMCIERYEKRIVEMEREREDERERLRVEIEKCREELDKERVKGEVERGKFKDQFVDLVNVKKKAEESARYWEMNFKECEPRVMKLENDILVLLRNDPALARTVKKMPLIRDPKSVINGNSTKQSNLSKYDENAQASPGAGSTAESPMVDTNGPAEAGPNSRVMAFANRMPTKNQVIIEIDDSDDENPIIETAASKIDKDWGRSYENDPASQSTSRRKHPLVCTNTNCDVDGSNKNKKPKMDSPLPIKTDENCNASDEIITDKLFKIEADMRTAFNKDDELCLNAVCALHRGDGCDKLPHASQYGGFNSIDATRGYHLAKFLTNGNSQGKLRKTVQDLQQYDPKGIVDCRRLARDHSGQLFQIYQNEEDPIFMEYLVRNYPKKTTRIPKIFR